MYYLKYRPQNIEELDNSAVREQLTRLLNGGNIPHAFLFTGPKGTGKTSTARIVAKVLNAEENAKKIKTLKPSPEDPNVRAITKGVSPDVIEMDAASNRKIDDIRELISELKFAPLVSQYKVYIIDEVHMLTKEAFNALLKSLEEPPIRTIFILATTEADSLPKTITSRCMVINFPHASTSDIESMLDRYISAEKLKVSDDVKKYIAGHADGSFRDAAKILDLAVMQNAKTVDDVKDLLGQTWYKGDFLQILDTGTVQEALEWIQHSGKNGANFKLLIESLLRTLHIQLLKKNKIEVESDSEYTFSVKDIMRLISSLQKAYNDMKISPVQSLPLEIATVEYFQDKKGPTNAAAATGATATAGTAAKTGTAAKDAASVKAAKAAASAAGKKST